MAAAASSFLPELIDVAFLGWVCHLERHTFPGTREGAGCFRRTLQQSRCRKDAPTVACREGQRGRLAVDSLQVCKFRCKELGKDGNPSCEKHVSTALQRHPAQCIWQKSVFTQVTNWGGKVACFGKLVTAKSQTSIGVCSRRVSWQCLQLGECPASTAFGHLWSEIELRT